MADKVKAWSKYGPRLERGTPITSEMLIRRLVRNTNQSRGSILAVLSELDEVIVDGLMEGRIVQLPNGTHYQPYGRSDGSVHVRVRVNPKILNELETNFHGEWINAENIGKDEAEIISLWNEANPDNPIVE